MRLAWIVANAHPAVASFRYRCLIPAWGMHQIGHDSAIFVDEQPDPADFDAMIIVKQAGDRLTDAARSFRARGKAVFLDLCDNVFIPGYSQRRDPDLTAEAAADLARQAHAVVTPSPALGRAVRSYLGEERTSWVVPDGAITPDTFQAMCAWLSYSRATVANGRPFIARNLLDRGMFGIESDPDWQVDHLPEDTARVLWFGRHGSFHSEFGMGLLRPVIEELERAHRDRPIELVVISNSQARFEALTHGAKIFTRYEAWSNERVFFELSRADLFVMPSATDAFSVCKSANRAVLALANNVPVVATYLEALEPLRDVIMLDDWRAGIDTYLFDRETAKEHLRRAQPILAEQFSVEAIGRQWNEALGTCLGMHVEPRIDWRQAAQSA
jgi:glycosyltransferase involved in cell wall biosynthesis